MLSISDILTPERTLYLVSGISKKKVFETIAETFSASLPVCRPHRIFDALIARERLGSTAIGHGVALPHTRLEETDQVLGCFVLLKESIDFEVQDHLFIDMLFSLVIPQETHAQYFELIDNIAKVFNHASNRRAFREATSSLDLYEKLIRA